MKNINKQITKVRIHKVQLFKSIKEVSNILSWEYSIDIVFLLSKEPMRYKQLKKELKLSDNTLSRRLDKLTEYKIIKRLEVSFGTRSGHEYTITELGQELIKFFYNYEYRRTSGGE
jgi:DNA-binding HxlR family transcriptional regulator